MRLTLPDGVTREIDAKAQALLPRLEPERPGIQESGSNFRLSLPLGAVHITGREFPARYVKSVIDYEGFEAARFFLHRDQWIGFVGSTHADFVNLCRCIQSQSTFRDQVSLTLIADVALHWFRSITKSGGSGASAVYRFSTAVISVCEPEVAKREVWLPLDGVEIAASFTVGDVKFRALEPPQAQSWAQAWRRPQRVSERSQHEVEEGRVQRRLQELCAQTTPIAVTAWTAEPIRAVELAVESCERALGIVRYFSMVNFHPHAVSRFALQGSHHTPISPYLIVEETLIAFASMSADSMQRPPERFTESDLAKMRKAGLEVLCTILAKQSQDRTAFENELLKAINIYSRASLMRDTSTRLLTLVIALESVFHSGEEGALRKKVAHRIAFLLGNSLEERRHIIRLYYRAYKLRSDAVHHGETPDDIQTLREFLRLAWHALNSLIKQSANFQSKEQMHHSLDDMKFA